MRFMKSVRPRSSQSGYVLLALMLTMTLILVALSIEAPRIAQQIKREKEEELIHRGKDYATAVKRFVHKNGGRYPASVEQLENTNHIRFLRKKYVDPMTGDSDWKMVHVGEAQVKIPTTNPSGNQSGSTGTLNTNPLGGSGNTGGLTGGTGQNGGTGGQNGGTGGLTGGAGGQNGGTGQLGSLNTSGGNGPTVGGGQIMGVASVSKGHSIKEFNEKDEYDQWYFVYDLRLEQSGGTGVTVGAPRVGTSSGSSGTAGATGSSGATGAAGSPGTQNPNGAQPPPDASGQPGPGGVTPGTPAQTPTPPPQVPH